MLWGCFSGKEERGGLYFLPKNVTMNADRYLQVLKDHLVPFLGIHWVTHYMQNGAQVRKVTNFLARKNVKFSTGLGILLISIP